LVKLPRFTRNELIILAAIGVLTPLIDDRVEHFLVTFFANISGSVNVFDYTGGPLNSDLLIVWEEYGAVLAAYLVRKPGAATLAMTINGFGQFFRDGFVGPHHLLYGFSGVGADVVFWAFRYRRYDARASALAGVAAQFFWVPFSYVYHVVYLYPLSFIGGDLLTRVIGGAIGDGLLGAGLGVAILQVGSWAGFRIGSPQSPRCLSVDPMRSSIGLFRRRRSGVFSDRAAAHGFLSTFKTARTSVSSGSHPRLLPRFHRSASASGRGRPVCRGERLGFSSIEFACRS